MNILFSYLYRDVGNYKKWGEVVFVNREEIDPAVLETNIRSFLFDREFFDGPNSALPELHFDSFDRELDHDWYEYQSVETTTEPANDVHNRDIKDFLDVLERKHLPDPGHW